MSSIDISRFWELAGEEDAGYWELVDLYLSKTQEQLAELKGAIQSNESALTARLAHTLIGANLMVGLQTMVTPLRRIESLGQAGDMGKALLEWDLVEKEFTTVGTLLKKRPPSM